MSDQEQTSQLSALFDNELPPAQSEMVIRRALKDPALRATWGRYALIGACVRGEPVLRDVRLPDIAERVRLALAAEVEHAEAAATEVPSTGAGQKRRMLLGRGALGGAIAAGVAVMALLAVRNMAPQAGPAAIIAQVPVTEQAAVQPVAEPAAAPVQVAAVEPLPSYTTPVDDSPAGQRLNTTLVNYVVAHSEVSASAVRFSPLSTTMNGNYDPAQAAAENAASDIGARR